MSIRLAASYTPAPLTRPSPPQGGARRYVLAFFCRSPAKHYGESAAFGGFSPFGAFGTTFPPLCGGTTTRTMLRATYRIIASRSFIVPPLAGGRWWRQPPKGGGSFSHGRSPVVKVLSYWRLLLFKRRLPQPSAAKPLSNFRTLRPQACQTSARRAVNPHGQRPCPYFFLCTMSSVSS